MRDNLKDVRHFRHDRYISTFRVHALFYGQVPVTVIKSIYTKKPAVPSYCSLAWREIGPLDSSREDEITGGGNAIIHVPEISRIAQVLKAARHGWLASC